MKKTSALFCALLLLGTSLSAQNAPPPLPFDPAEKLPFMPNAKRGVLPNGLTYYVLENKRPENRAFIRLAVNAGSVLEDDDEQGLAHFVEHMAFNGTTRFPESELISYMRSLGMRFGADLNAYTSFDETVYMLETPVFVDADGKKTVPAKALDIFDDWTRAILFTEKDVDEERAVILEEKRTRGGVNERMRDIFYPLLFSGSPYAQRLPIGKTDIIENARAATLKRFYQKWYRPENMALIIVGDFDAEALAARLPAIYTAPRSKTPVSRPRFPLPPPKPGTLTARVWTDSELPAAQIRLVYKQAWEAPAEDAATALRHTLDNLIDRVISERLDDLTQDPRSACAGAGAGLAFPARQAAFYMLTARAKDGKTREALTELLRVKEAVVRYSFGERELERAKTALLSDFERVYAERDKRASSGYVEEFTSHFLSGIEAPGIEYEFEMTKKLLGLIDTKMIEARARTYFSYNEVLLFISAPERSAKELPSEAEAAALIQSAPLLEVPPPSDAEASGDLLPALPPPGAITREASDSATGARLFTLSNGAKVIVQTTANKDDDVTLYALAKGGTANAAGAATVSARLASEVMAGSGLGEWKLSELSRKLSGAQVSLSFSASFFTRAIQGNANRAGLDTLFQLLYLQFTAPRLDQDALTVVRDNWTARLITRDENPDNAFADELRRVMYCGDPRFAPLRLSDLDALDAEAARAFIARCLNPGDWTFVFCGNITADEVKPLLESYLAAIPALPPGAASFSGYPPGGEVARPEAGTHTLYKGKDERGMVYLSRAVPARFDLLTALAANVLSDYLDIVLTTEIREKRGGVYSVSPGATLSPLPPRRDRDGGAAGELALDIHFVCDPRRIAELRTACAAILEQTAAGAIDADAYQKARSALLRGLEESLQSNVYVARSIANFTVVFGLDIQAVYQRDKLYEQVTAERMRQVLRRLLDAGEVGVLMYPAAARE